MQFCELSIGGRKKVWAALLMSEKSRAEGACLELERRLKMFANENLDGI
jgi:hypothetical protein